jgi:hypothetical protein
MDDKYIENLMSMIIRLFYTNRCNECKNIIQVINNEGILNMFTMVCLDEMTANQIANIKIKKLPSIVISYPNGKPNIYEGPNECSVWLNNFTLNRRKNLANQIQQNMKLIQKANMEYRQKDNILEYIGSEMEGTSDDYACIIIDSNIPQPKNCVMIGNESNHIVTPQVNEEKITPINMKRKLIDVEANRKNDNEEFMKEMELNQIRAVVNSNVNF